MKNILLLIFIVIPFFVLSQEKQKRLALIIGNSNYEKGVLKNPVNDARLMASTLDSLNFDVLLKENLSTRREMTDAIREFESKLSEYEVSFVYYAGHGIQVDNQNYLLPTKEVFKNETDVLDYGINIQKILRALTSKSNLVSILVLDACRDNPFEREWNSTRSLSGQGLAKVPAPTGSLIAFSTDSGQTAADGLGDNSLYTGILADKLKEPSISIEQVFKNVRTEVLKITSGSQRPVEESQLTGGSIYLVPLDYVKIINDTYKLFDSGKYYDALELITSLINNKNYKKSSAYTVRSEIYQKLDNYDKALEDINTFIDLNIRNDNSYSTQDVTVTQDMLIESGYLSKSTLNFRFKYYQKAIDNLTFIIDNTIVEKNKKHAYFSRAWAYQEFAEEFYNTPEYKKEIIFYELSINDYKKVTSGYFQSAFACNNLANVYSYIGKDDLALEAINKAIILKPDDPSFLMNRANIYKDIGQNNNALKQYDELISLYPNIASLYYNRGFFHAGNKNYELALKDYKKTEEKSDDINLLKQLYFYRAKVYHSTENYFNEVLDLNKVINIDPDYYLAYKNRGLAYLELSKFNKAIKDFEKVLEIAPYYNKVYSLLAEAYNKTQNYEKAILNYEKAISVNITEEGNYLLLSNLHKDIGDNNSALEVLFLFNKNNPKSPFGHIELGRMYSKSNDLEKSQKSFESALLIDPNSYEAYERLGYNFFIQYKFNDALPYFKRAVELNPKELEPRLYQSMVFMLQRKFENFDAVFDEFSAEFPFFKLYHAYGYSSLGAEDKNEDYFKKSLLILKDFNKKNGYNYVSNLLEFMANWSLSNHNKALLNISQAIANFGKDTFDENETNMVWKMTIFGKSALEINLIDLYLFRSNIYSILEDNTSSCEDLNNALSLMKSYEINEQSKYFAFGENRTYQYLLETSQNCTN